MEQTFLYINILFYAWLSGFYEIWGALLARHPHENEIIVKHYMTILAAPPGYPGKTAWPGNSTASLWSSHYWSRKCGLQADGAKPHTPPWEELMGKNTWHGRPLRTSGRQPNSPTSPIVTQSHGKPHLVNFLRDIQYIFPMPQKLQMWSRQRPRGNLEDIPLVCFSGNFSLLTLQ